MPENSEFLILLVDDNASNLKVLGSVLSSRGYRIALAANGDECLAFVEQQIPDLIFLDIMMPGMNGFEVCEKLKSNSDTKNIPVIFISALANPQHIQKAFESGGIDYVTKPFNKDDLLARAKVHLGIKQDMDSLRQKIMELEEKVRQLGG
jgi:two-component system sensor histidine kinase/response regulator